MNMVRKKGYGEIHSDRFHHFRIIVSTRSLKFCGQRCTIDGQPSSIELKKSSDAHSSEDSHNLAKLLLVPFLLAQGAAPGQPIKPAEGGTDKQVIALSRTFHAPDAVKLSPEDQAVLDKIEKAHFEYFRQQSDPVTGLTKDRSREGAPSSIAAVGFSLSAHGVAAERGWITRAESADYTLKVLNTLWAAPQGNQAEGVSGDHGFFYHFLDPKTATRSGKNELSTVDTALLMSGVLYSKDFFDRNDPKEQKIRELADKLYQRVDWNWAVNQSGRLSMGWTPEKGFIKSDWRGYNEASIMVLLGMGSPTHPLPDNSWDKYTATDKVGKYYGEKCLEFGPLFGHQYSQIWLDFRGLEDNTTKKIGWNYFENSRRAAVIQQKYAIDNPKKFCDYGATDWGLTASDGPGDLAKLIEGRWIKFRSYFARGFPKAFDDGTIAPTAAAASLPFAPDIVMPTLKHWLKDRPEIFGPLGFYDAFNPTFDKSRRSGWIDNETLGIDQGPILLMTENYRTGSVWQTMHKDPYLKTGLQRAGFSERPHP